MSRQPTAIRIGPCRTTGAPMIEMAFDDGTRVRVTIDVAHAKKIAERLTEIVDGRICERAPSRRDLDIALACEETAETLVPLRAAGDGR